MSLRVDFGDGTEVDTWETVFGHLDGWVMRITEATNTEPFDVVFKEIGPGPNGSDEWGFWFWHWDELGNRRSPDQFWVPLDELTSMYIY